MVMLCHTVSTVCRVWVPLTWETSATIHLHNFNERKINLHHNFHFLIMLTENNDVGWVQNGTKYSGAQESEK